MRLSHITKVPDFKDIQISDNNRMIKINDRTIFREIKNENRRIEDTNKPAKKGDYVQVEVSAGEQEPKVIHIELGKQHYQAYEEVLFACTPNQVFTKVIYGKETNIKVISVKETKEMELTDENIEKLQLPGIHSVKDYRKDYVRRNKKEVVDRAFQALKKKFLKQLETILEVELVEAEVDKYNQNQRDMIETIAGDVEERLMVAYGKDGEKSLEECEALFKKDNTKNFKMIVLGDAMAKKNHRQISEEEKRDLLENYKLIHEKSDEEIEAKNLMEQVLEPFYLQYAIQELQNYYESVVKIITQ